MLFGFFAFLRASEFTLPSVNHFDPAIHLAPADIAVDSHSNPTLMQIRLKYSKGPLFMWDGRSLSRESLVQRLRATLSKAGINPSHFSGHSFRIGAASTAAARGIGESTVQTLG